MAGVLSAAVTTTTLPHSVPIQTVPGSLAPGAGSIVVHGGGSGAVTFTQSSGLGLFSTFFSLLSIMAIFAVLGAFVIIVVANRADPDPTGTRATTVYAFAVSFVTVIAVLIASTVMVGALITLITPHRCPGCRRRRPGPCARGLGHPRYRLDPSSPSSARCQPCDGVR